VSRIGHRLFHSRGRWLPYGWGCTRCDTERFDHLNNSPAVARARETMKRFGFDVDGAILEAMEQSRRARPRL
jgi:hypothetical protein